MEPLYINESDVRQITDEQALDLPRGSVILVRSDYKNQVYGDHPALILGGTIKKERGVRPNLLTFGESTVININTLLNLFDPINNKIILLLNENATKKFMTNQGIHLSEGELVEVKAMAKLKILLNP